MSGLGGLNKSAHGVVLPVRDYAPQIEAQRKYA